MSRWIVLIWVGVTAFSVNGSANKPPGPTQVCRELVAGLEMKISTLYQLLKQRSGEARTARELLRIRGEVTEVEVSLREIISPMQRLERGRRPTKMRLKELEDAVVAYLEQSMDVLDSGSIEHDPITIKAMLLNALLKLSPESFPRVIALLKSEDGESRWKILLLEVVYHAVTEFEIELEDGDFQVLFNAVNPDLINTRATEVLQRIERVIEQ